MAFLNWAAPCTSSDMAVEAQQALVPQAAHTNAHNVCLLLTPLWHRSGQGVHQLEQTVIKSVAVHGVDVGVPFTLVFKERMGARDARPHRAPGPCPQSFGQQRERERELCGRALP